MDLWCRFYWLNSSELLNIPAIDVSVLPWEHQRMCGMQLLICMLWCMECVHVHSSNLLLYMLGVGEIYGRLCLWVCLGLSLLSNSLWLSRMMSSYLSCNLYCNSLLARITKQSNSPDVWFLVATLLATEKISVATQLTTQLHKSRCKSNGLEFYRVISYFSVYWEIAKPFVYYAFMFI
jgi:hypothetical protein